MRSFSIALTVVCAMGLSACSFSGGGGSNASDASPLPDAPSGPCEPSEAPSCVVGTTLRECADDGSGYVDTLCPLGCLEDGGAHCGEFIPSNGVPLVLREADLVVSDSNVSFNGVSGEIAIGGTTMRPAGLGIDDATKIGFTVLTQVNGPDIGVFELNSLTVELNAVIRVRGRNAVAITAIGPVDIAGLIDVSSGPGQCVESDARCAGPAGGVGGLPATLGGSIVDTMGAGGAGDMGDDMGGGESGGGGGGFASAGGASGTPIGSEPAAGGLAWAPDELIPLVGGSGGGGGGTELQDQSVLCNDTLPPYLGGIGGGGGGAIQIVSATSIRVDATQSRCGIDAGGSGGAPGQCSASGGGGGAGGGVLLEAPTIELGASCVLVANGGGGGASDNIAQDAPGADGTRTDTPALGGGAAEDQGGAGAAGNAVATASMDNGDESAGGGGGGGRIVLRALSTGITTDGIVSPTGTKRALVVF